MPASQTRETIFYNNGQHILFLLMIMMHLFNTAFFCAVHVAIEIVAFQQQAPSPNVAAAYAARPLYTFPLRPRK